MFIARRGKFVAALGVAALAAVQGTQLHAAAVTTNEGAGPGVITFTAPTTTIDCTTTYAVTGTAVMAVHGPAGTYEGPVTITGTASQCGSGIIPPAIQLVVTGSSDFGDFGCGTATSPMQGYWVAVVDDVISTAGTCHVAGATLPGDSIFEFSVTSPEVPTALSSTPPAYASWTDAGVAGFSNG